MTHEELGYRVIGQRRYPKRCYVYAHLGPDRVPFYVGNPRDATKHLTTIKHGWHTVRDAAGLPDLRIHDLRHSAASFMVNSGVDLFAVGKVLGHANVASSARYSHLANDTLLAAVEAGAAKQAQHA